MIPIIEYSINVDSNDDDTINELENKLSKSKYEKCFLVINASEYEIGLETITHLQSTFAGKHSDFIQAILFWNNGR